MTIWIQIRSFLILKFAHVRISSDFCKQFGPRSGPTASHDRMQKVLNSHGQENQFFNDRHKIIANNIFGNYFMGTVLANTC